MDDLQNRQTAPAMEELYAYVRLPAFRSICETVCSRYKTVPVIEYSTCSFEPGWHVKFRKGGKSLCILYLREGYFTALVVVGQKEKNAVELLLPACTHQVQDIYWHTREGCGQRWLMIDVRAQDEVYEDVLRLIDIRRQCK